jgi:hypothetical protein
MAWDSEDDAQPGSNALSDTLATASSDIQKFFGSFFQKRTAFFL